MKKMLIMCGAGHATSTVVRAKVEDWLKTQGLSNQVTIKQSAVGDEIDNIKPKVINGVALLTGIGADKVYNEVKKEIEE